MKIKEDSTCKSFPDDIGSYSAFPDRVVHTHVAATLFRSSKIGEQQSSGLGRKGVGIRHQVGEDVGARGLLDKIIDFSAIGAAGAGSAVITLSHAKATKRSLQVVKMLAETTGSMGKLFRREVAEIVFTVSNNRIVLEHGGGHLELQRLGTEVLTRLAMDADAREKIDGVGGGRLPPRRHVLATEHHQRGRHVEAGKALIFITTI
ncbi:hypothetical protein E2562_003040 [Oryza meyeriana var. granulata]|uniref:Uncharacterized protein n=1 Tax=Oryza meyeriana var. granulata TaxID=110450 RepID=A0A6G1DDB5_9ORYZ|nr:hypothetical protein E2562_003040 [Oryza meyeriana var. granulata]